MLRNVVQLSPRTQSDSQGPLLATTFGLVEAQDISRKWLYSQTFFYVCAAISGFLCAYTLRTFRNIFMDSCLLNIELNFRNKDGAGDVQAAFGPSTSCDFCEFVPVVCSISALVLAMFFIMSGRGGKGSPGFLPRPWRIVVPALLFNIIFLVCIIISTTVLHNGLQRFCEQLIGKQLEMSGADGNATATDISINPQHGFRTLTGCRVDLNISGPITPGSHNPLHAMTPSNYALLEISELASWCSVISWGFCAFITLLRFLCMADFKLTRFDFLLESKEMVKQRESSNSSLRTADEQLAEGVNSSEVLTSSSDIEIVMEPKHSALAL